MSRLEGCDPSLFFFLSLSLSAFALTLSLSLSLVYPLIQHSFNALPTGLLSVCLDKLQFLPLVAARVLA